jgi:hypothetical protein
MEPVQITPKASQDIVKLAQGAQDLAKLAQGVDRAQVALEALQESELTPKQVQKLEALLKKVSAPSATTSPAVSEIKPVDGHQVSEKEQAAYVKVANEFANEALRQRRELGLSDFASREEVLVEAQIKHSAKRFKAEFKEALAETCNQGLSSLHEKKGWHDQYGGWHREEMTIYCESANYGQPQKLSGWKRALQLITFGAYGAQPHTLENCQSPAIKDLAAFVRSNGLIPEISYGSFRALIPQLPKDS